MSDRFKNALRGAWNKIEEGQWVYGKAGRLNADGTYTFAVPGRKNFIYVTVRTASDAQTVVPARNDAGVEQAPRLAVKMRLEYGVYVIHGRAGRQELGTVNPAVPATGVLEHTHDDRYYTEDEHINSSAGVGDAGKPVKLNASGLVDNTMLDLSALPDTFLELDDTPASYAGEAGKVVAVKATEDGLEYIVVESDVAAAIDAAAEQTVLEDTNRFALNDSGVLKWASWSGIKAALTSLFNSLYVALTGDQNVAGIKTFTGTEVRVDAGAATNAYIRFAQNLVNKALIGIAGAADALVTGTAAGDLAIRTGQKILISTDEGVTAAVLIEADGDVAVGGGLTVGYGGATHTQNRLKIAPSNGANTGAVLEFSNGTDGMFWFLEANASGGKGHIRTDSARAIILQDASTSSGGVGVGTAVPQGKLHVYDGAATWLHASKTGIVGTAQTIMPEGTGDVTLAVRIVGLLGHTDGSSVQIDSVVTLGSFVAVALSTGTVRIDVSAGGGITTYRSAGSGTFKLAALFIWL